MTDRSSKREYRKISKAVRRAREKSGLSRAELAKRMNVSITSVANYEKGLRNVNLVRLKQIADITNTPLDYFIKQSEPIFNDEDSYITIEEASKTLSLISDSEFIDDAIRMKLDDIRCCITTNKWGMVRMR